jgi:hypothetical protein
VTVEVAVVVLAVFVLLWLLEMFFLLVLLEMASGGGLHRSVFVYGGSHS